MIEFLLATGACAATHYLCNSKPKADKAARRAYWRNEARKERERLIDQHSEDMRLVQGALDVLNKHRPKRGDYQVYEAYETARHKWLREYNALTKQLSELKDKNPLSIIDGG